MRRRWPRDGHPYRVFCERGRRLRGLRPSETDYRAWTRTRTVLRFSKSGNPHIERAYRTHWVGPAPTASPSGYDMKGQVFSYWETPELSARPGHRNCVYLVSLSTNTFNHGTMFLNITMLPPAGNPCPSPAICT